MTEAFDSYDFDGDARWKEYVGRLEIPAGRESALVRFKARWYRDNVDASFDPFLAVDANESKGGEPAAPAARSGSTTSRTTVRSASTSAPAPPSAHAAFPAYPLSVPAPPPTSPYVALVVLLLNVCVVLGAALSIFPLVPSSLRRPAFFAATQLSSLVGVNALLAKHGKPSFSTFKTWMDGVKDSEDLFRVLLCMVLAGNQTLVFGSIVGAIASARDAVEIAVALLAAPPAGEADSRPSLVRSAAAKYGPLVRTAHSYVRSHDAQARLAQATGAITTSILALLSAPSSGIRSFGTAWVLWNQLRVRTKSADTGIYYVTVWKAMDEKFGHILRKVSVADKALNWAQGWFSRA